MTQLAHDGHTKHFQEGGWRLKSARRVVVASDEHNAEVSKAALCFPDESVKKPVGSSRRIGAIEDIASDQHGVGFFGFERVQKPGEELLVLESTLVAV
jgi:hypothetical protein